MNLTSLVTKLKTSSLINIERVVTIKKYISIKEKFKIVDEYREIFKQHREDYPKYESYVAFIFFNLIVVKYYTNIDIQLTYEEFDLLSSSNLLSEIVQKIGQDYSLLMQLAQININK